MMNVLFLKTELYTEIRWLFIKLTYVNKQAPLLVHVSAFHMI
jgi:hypothetical protein